MVLFCEKKREEKEGSHMRNHNRRIKRSRWGIKLVSSIVLLFCIVIAYKGNELNQKAEQYQEKIDNYNENIKELERESKEIEDLKSYVETKGYIEKMAREKLGLVYDNEIIFKAEP